MFERGSLELNGYIHTIVTTVITIHNFAGTFCKYCYKQAGFTHAATFVV